MKSQPSHYRSLISPTDTTLIIVDCQPGILAAPDGGGQSDLDSVVDLVNTAHERAVTVIAATVEKDRLSGDLLPELVGVVRAAEVLKRRCDNPWDDGAFRAAVSSAGRARLVVAGRSSEVYVTFTVLSALEEGYDVYVVTDTSVGTTERDHDTTIERMVQAGRPATQVPCPNVRIRFWRLYIGPATYLAQHVTATFGFQVGVTDRVDADLQPIRQISPRRQARARP